MSAIQRLDISSLNIDKERVKTNLQELFKNPNLIWELYKTLSLNDTDTLSYLERLSHYSIIKKLYESMPNIDEFSSSERTLDSCFKWKYDDIFFLYKSLLPSIFSSFKELNMGKTSRQSWLNRLNDEDLQELSNIRVVPNDLSKKQIVSEIRNAINHTHYVPWNKEVYIKNPKNQDPKIHARDFEADVPYVFLLHFILLTRVYNRRVDYYSLKIDDQNLLESLLENPKDIKYEDVKDKIHFYQGVSKEKLWDWTCNSAANAVETKEFIRSEQVEEVIWEYFSNHKLDMKNLRYVAESLMGRLEIYMWEIFMTLIPNQIKWSTQYKWLKSPELVMDVYKNMRRKKYYWFYEWFDSIEGKDTIIALCKELEKQHQSWQSILKYFPSCKEFANRYLKKKGFLKYEQRNIVLFKKWDEIIDGESIYSAIYELCTQYYIIGNMVKLFPNWMRGKLINYWYVNEQLSLQDEYVDWLITKKDTSQDENGKGKKPTRERIRDARSHDTYTMLQGVDNVVLRDWYDKKTDSWSREATFDLSKLSESMVNEINKSDIASSYSSLLELLNLLDN